MRSTAVALCLLAALGCARELRSTHPELWLELESDHFTLRTDLPEEDARKDIADLELLRSALLAAGWHANISAPLPSRIGVVALANARELKEILSDQVEGVATIDRFGERLILIPGNGNLLHSETVKHEIAHALFREWSITRPRWVDEGLAVLLETLEINRRTGTATRGGIYWERRDWLRDHQLAVLTTNWSLEVMGMGSTVDHLNGYQFETLAWGLVHWLVDDDPKKFNAFVSRLARGDGMWTAFNGTYPGLTEAKILQSMVKYLKSTDSVGKRRFAVTPWEGTVVMRHPPPAEVHALRAQLFARLGEKPNARKKFDEELALAKADDPANPLMLALSENNPDVKLAIDRHPEDWRSWELWFDDNEKDIAAIRKAWSLAPDNAGVLARLAIAEQSEGKSKDALAHAELAVAISPGAFALHSLATVYEENGRCAEAVTAEERAVDALHDRIDARLPALFRERLQEIVARCGKRGVIGNDTRVVEAQPVLKLCRQPASLRRDSADGVSAQFTIREDGTVTAVAIHGSPNDRESGVLRQFIESCSFEPVVVAGKPRQVQLNLKLEALLH
jgi:tetratricopeptide (TPR) repeat protein